jgi:hypothetical protein
VVDGDRLAHPDSPRCLSVSLLVVVTEQMASLDRVRTLSFDGATELLNSEPLGPRRAARPGRARRLSGSCIGSVRQTQGPPARKACPDRSPELSRYACRNRVIRDTHKDTHATQSRPSPRPGSIPAPRLYERVLVVRPVAPVFVSALTSPWTPGALPGWAPIFQVARALRRSGPEAAGLLPNAGYRDTVRLVG